MTRPRIKLDTIRLDTALSHYFEIRFETVCLIIVGVGHGWTRSPTQMTRLDMVSHGCKYISDTVWHTLQYGWARFAFLENTVARGSQLSDMV